ncbi:hypothetical protein OUZ56_001262 [Daphnia magna]|uniref:Uncharacterized protein n=1 Tax=Daphnia magna TaxID=35525 RepID=A0ABR0A242_9CRUS|nr:hypothetical protein OUZ56_001262 [Daphnia magna]
MYCDCQWNGLISRCDSRYLTPIRIYSKEQLTHRDDSARLKARNQQLLMRIKKLVQSLEICS